MFKFVLFAMSALAVSIPSLGAEVAPMALNGYSVAPKKLATAVVYNQNNHAIGIVKVISTDAGGRPISVAVLLPGGAVHQVPAGAAVYDPIANELVVDNAQVAQTVVTGRVQVAVAAAKP